MNLIYPLKFANEAEFRALIATEPNWLKDVETIVEVGVIIKYATFDEEGNELTPEKAVEGFHVDMLGHALIQELEPYCLDTIPNTPVHGTGWAENDYMIVTKDSY